MSRTKKSKGYNIGGSKYSFDIVNDKIVGIKKADENGQFGNSLENEYLNPKLSTFGDIAASDEALNAYNIAKYGSNKNGYEDSVAQATSAELQDYFNEQGKKATNQAAIAIEENLEDTFYGGYTPSRQTEGVYGREYGYERKNRLLNEVLSDFNEEE